MFVLFAVSLVFGLFLHFSLFFGCRWLFPVVFERLKALAWLLTFASSVVLSIGSIPLLVVYLFYSSNLVHFVENCGQWPSALSGYFVSYMICDLVLGLRYYKDQITFASGWFHHSFYSFMIFYLTSKGVSALFPIFGFVEIPTAIIACGFIFPSKRADLLFGISFFLTRILGHGYLTYQVLLDFPDELYFCFGLFVLPLHFFWFNGWINQQQRIRQKKQFVLVVDQNSVKNTKKASL